jgi:hypothetical protein
MDSMPLPASNGRSASAADLCRDITLDPDARALLGPSMSPRVYVETLLDAKLNVAAIEVVAQALSRRLGVWWGLLCLEHSTGPRPLTLEEANLCRVVVRWVCEPTEPVRAVAEKAARAIGPASIAGQLGFAVATAATPQGVVPIGNAVKLACAGAPPALIRERQRAYAVLGLDIRLPPDLPRRSRAVSVLACA